MASPWKFLSRLVSPRRQLKRNDGSIDVEPDISAMAEPTGIPVEENGNPVEQPTPESAQPFVQSEPVSPEPEPLTKAGGNVQGTGVSDSEKGAETSDPALPHIDATRGHATPKVEATVKPAPAKTRSRAKTIESVAVVPTISDEMSLDLEIRGLRHLLANKLLLQNAQLNQMLKRFDR